MVEKQEDFLDSLLSGLRWIGIVLVVGLVVIAALDFIVNKIPPEANNPLTILASLLALSVISSFLIPLLVVVVLILLIIYLIKKIVK